MKDDSRRLYPAWKCSAHMCKGTQKKGDHLIDEGMITDETSKAAVFHRHFEEQYTPPTDRPKDITQLLEKCKFRLDIDQVQKAVNSRRNGRAVGVCSIPSERYKFGSENLHRCLLLLFNLIMNTMTIPKDFTTSIIVPLFKTEKPRGMRSSFWPVSLLCTGRKIMMSGGCMQA